MGVIAMLGATAFFWRVVGARAALVLVGFLIFGYLSYLARTDSSRQCDGRAWFCAIIPERSIADAPPPCPAAEPITTRIFESSAADAEVHRLIANGVCQQDAIDNVVKGWKARYASEYRSWLQRMPF